MRTTGRRGMRRLLIGWTVFCLVGWLIGWAAARGNEEHCRSTSGYLCLSDRSVFLLASIVALVAFVAGLLVIAIVWTARDERQRRRDA